jgi:hypothetical protein
MARSKKSNVRWVGPFQLRTLLEKCMDDDQPWPPESNGVYVVSLERWAGIPDKEAGILYAGGNTSNSPLFLTRVGSLIADMLGFWWHHSGGQSLYEYCRTTRKKRVHPLDLYLGWVEGIACGRCAEVEVYEALEPELCKKRPAACGDHAEIRRVCLPSS